MRRNLIRRDLLKIRKLQQQSKKDERDGGRQVSPIARQQNAGDNDHQRIEEIKKGINASGHVDHGRGECKVGEYLGNGLHLVFAPERLQEGKKNRDREPDHHDGDKHRGRNMVGREVNDQEFNRKQKRDDDDTDFYKPCQP